MSALLCQQWRPRDSAQRPLQAADKAKKLPQQPGDAEKLLQSGELDQVSRGVALVADAADVGAGVLRCLCEVAASRCVPPGLRVRCVRAIWGAMNGTEATALKHLARANAAGAEDSSSPYAPVVRCLSLGATLNTPEAVAYCSQIVAAVNLFELLRRVAAHAVAVARQDAADEEAQASADGVMSSASSLSAARAQELLCQLHGARQCLTDILPSTTNRTGIEERLRMATKTTRGVEDWLLPPSQSELPRVVAHALLESGWISAVTVLLMSASVTRNCTAHRALSAVVRGVVCQLLSHRQGVLVFAARCASTSRLVAALKSQRVSMRSAHGGACLQWCVGAAQHRASGADVARVLDAYARAMAAVLMLKQPHAVHHNPGVLSAAHMSALQQLSQLMVTAAGREAVATVVSWFALDDLLRVLLASWHPRGVVPQHAVDILLCAVRDAREDLVWRQILRSRDKGDGERGVDGAGAKSESSGGDKDEEGDDECATAGEGLVPSVSNLLDRASKPSGNQRTSRTLLQVLNTP